ncbi:hypothetical protein GobsT_68590 [Gemmata obscuriglobus]|uniref:Uncharacterized protein n=1 Tax=Gemmata obscuriglobus TaxID=114 RepID=A0A2Z3HKJ0_9BACT|nr:hypothetical protein [Gemmata obscuriglobus]AWM42000.1 hypothetical protein C1280_36770 [Gemmata obscuriglobus]QEG32010.1 hypothetical protein GobsT_68590 [Gemmata obscuriglobus]VTS11360.1 unnamed protein product [Gemmata obscuriglobus UQM 2246]
MTADPRARWAEQFGIPADAPPDEAAAAFLRSLPADLVPAPVQALAAGELAGAELPTGLEDGRETALDAEVEAFAGRFWSLPPAERLLEWDRLSHRGANPVRLRELEPGLDAASAALGDPVAEELAEQFRTLFVLPPRARAIQRAQWLLARADDIDRWRSALPVVQRDAPALVALEPRLRTALDPAFGPAALAAGARAPTVRAGGPAGFHPHAHQFGAHEPAASHGSRGANWRQVASPAIGIGVILLLKALLTGPTDGKRPSDGPWVPNSSVRMPTFEKPQRPLFTVAEVAEFRRYEQSRGFKGNDAPPRDYAAWIAAGKPEPLPPIADTGPKRSDAKFTAEEVAACQLYESEHARDRSAVRPPIYERWLSAGRPEATDGREPGPNEVRVYLDAFLIAACQRHERVSTAPPFRYGDWVRAGRPTKPGSYIIPQQTTSP